MFFCRENHSDYAYAGNTLDECYANYCSDGGSSTLDEMTFFEGAEIKVKLTQVVTNKVVKSKGKQNGVCSDDV